MHYFTCEFFTELIWNVQALDLLQSEKLFYFFLIFNFENSAEIRTPTMVSNGEVGGEQGGLVRHACMYISEPFLNVKAVHFWEVLIFLFPFSFKHFCSELLLYIADNWKEYKNMCCSLRTTARRWFNTLKTLIKRNNDKGLHFKCHSYIPCGWELYTFTHFFRGINYWITETLSVFFPPTRLCTELTLLRCMQCLCHRPSSAGL